VIPAAIVGTFQAWPMQNRLWHTGSIRLAFGPPLNLDGLQTDAEITAAIEREVRRLFHGRPCNNS
jgi:hypothetical protein